MKHRMAFQRAEEGRVVVKSHLWRRAFCNQSSCAGSGLLPRWNATVNSFQLIPVSISRQDYTELRLEAQHAPERYASCGEHLLPPSGTHRNNRAPPLPNPWLYAS